MYFFMKLIFAYLFKCNLHEGWNFPLPPVWIPEDVDKSTSIELEWWCTKPCVATTVLHALIIMMWWNTATPAVLAAVTVLSAAAKE